MLRIFMSLFAAMLSTGYVCVAVASDNVADTPAKVALLLRHAILSHDTPSIMKMYCGTKEKRDHWAHIMEGTVGGSALIFENVPKSKVPLARLPAEGILKSATNVHIYYLERPQTRHKPVIGDRVMVMYYPQDIRVRLETEHGGIPESILDSIGTTVLLTELVMGPSGWCWDDLFVNERGVD